MSEETYILTESKLNKMLAMANEEGANKVLIEMGLKKNRICQNEAFKRYGETRILRWRKEKKTKPIKCGNKIYYPLDVLERLNKINELI